MKLKSKKEKREQFFALQGLTPQGFAPQVLKLTPIRAFSVAEAMIALLIGTIVLGFSAPMITKQLKHNNFTSIQSQILNKKIENVDDKSDANAGKISQIIGTKTPSDYATYIRRLEADINKLLNNQNIKDVMDGAENTDYDDDIDALQNQIDAKVSTTTLNSKISSLSTSLTNKITTEINKLKEELKSKLVPSGAVMAFNLSSCPTGWTPLSNIVANSGGVFIRNVGGSAASSGTIQQAGVPNIKATWRGPWENANQGWSWVSGSVTVSLKSDANAEIPNYSADKNVYYSFDASKSSSLYQNNLTEVRPKNIAFLYCVKN